jgi:uncharacterized membrane protein
MDIVLMDWLGLGLRWLHVVAGIAWIGSSFYFVHLDLSLRPQPSLPPGTQGEAWQVHGGGFYHMVKYLVAPTRMPDELTWFKWEAYTTWLSGFALMVATYYLAADLYLIDRNVFELSPALAVSLSLIGLIVGWIGYDALCRSAIGRHENLLAAIGWILLIALCYALTRVFSGRGAFLQMGALIGTIMVANVFLIIIPNQRKIVAALLAGREPDPAHGRVGKQRSVHNNYLTLPVVFLMISGHYPLMFATRYNWLIFAVVLALGFIIRHFFNSRHAGRPSPWWALVVAAIGLIAIAWLSWAGARLSLADARSRFPTISFAQAQDVVLTRCSACHAAEPVWAGIAVAPKNVILNSPEEIRRHARQIAINAVLTNAMPPGNLTEISDEDRQILAAGLAAER